MRSENIDNNQNAWIEPSHRTRVKKTPRLLKQDSNLNTKYFNIKDLAVEIDRNFPLIYNLEPRSSLEETSYKNLIESNNSDSKETVCSKNEKISNLIKSSSINSQIAASTRNLNRHDDYAKPKTIKGSKTVSSCYILQLYFIYLILCVVIMSFSFGYYYTIVSTRLKIDKLEKKMDEKISKKISVMMFEAKSYSEVKNKLDSNEEYNENYEMDDQELKNSKIKLYKMKQIGFKNKKPSNSEKNENFFVPKEIDSMENYFKEFKTTKSIQVNKATEITTKILGDRSSSISSLLQENVSNLTENNSNEFQQIIEVIKFTEPSVSSFETDHSKENNTTNVANTYSAMVNQTSNLIDHLKNNYKKERHRKRLEIESGNSTMQNRIFSKKTQINQCYLNLIDKKPTPLIFLGVFHCNLMIDIGSSNTNYYLTKGFKGTKLLFL
ncbi:unnamed protein product [Brachionus calyciflorus]|uniref:Uncharacterized protein n=1 Tax=Brachionus calyciflorus TaxID=104777 RepID=A0A814MKW1_9BILA|nr:unnamed protein product [Brachionus calyciflorus]